ncbi:MAG: flagellin [Acidobacteria bacterium]|nr:flagellin [Acidobacteriota bacterium]
MALSILNNIASLAARNQLQITGAGLQSTLFRLSSGSRINTGADDAVGLAIADGLRANVTALSQSARNASDGVGQLQVADGALAQVTNLLNRAITLGTQASTGTVSSSQRTALNSEFTAIKAEIDRIGVNTTFNGSSVFSASTTSIFLSDAASNSTIAVSVGALSSSAIGTTSPVNLSVDDLTTAANATTALANMNTAVANVASIRGTLGASINRLQSAVNVINNQVQNLTAAEDGIRAADIAQEVANLTRFSILNQTGVSALAQANSQQQSVLQLLK